MILQKHLPYTPWADPGMTRSPGIQPLETGDWLVMDEAYAGQMAERDRLIALVPEQVHALDPSALSAAQELLDLLLDDLARRPGFEVSADTAVRPDGVTVPIDRDAPLATAGRLVQEDLCLLQKRGAEHVLTGAILCFPASWTLAEKFLRPLIRIHRPVAPYDGDLAIRVQRLFDGLRPGRVLWRANAHLYADPALFHPRREAAPREASADVAPYLRSERQCLLRLPRSGAVVFSIHTYVLRRGDLTPRQQATLAAAGLPVDGAT